MNYEWHLVNSEQYDGFSAYDGIASIVETHVMRAGSGVVMRVTHFTRELTPQWIHTMPLPDRTLADFGIREDDTP